MASAADPADCPQGHSDTVKLLVMARPGEQAAGMFRHLDRAAQAGPLTPDDVTGIAAQYGVRFG